MSRQVGKWFARGVLIAVAGCAFQVGNTPIEVGVKVNEQQVNDSLEAVSQRIQDEMRRFGLQVVASPERDVVRLTSTTKSGQKFVVVLSRVTGTRAEQTRLHIDWDTSADKELWLQLALVAGQTVLTGK